MGKKVEIIFLFFMIVMIGNITACSNQSDPKKKETTTETVSKENKGKKKEEAYYYQISFQDITMPLDSIATTYVFKNNMYVIGYRNEKNKKGTTVSKYYLICMKLDGSDKKEIKLNIKEEEEPYRLTVGKENQIYLLSQLQTYDLDLGETIEEYYIHTISIEEGKEESCKLKIKKQKTELLYIQDMIVTEDTILFNSQENVYTFDLKGKEKGRYHFGNYTARMAQTGNGDIYISGYSENNYGLKKLDLKKGEFGNFINLVSKKIYRTQGGNYNIILQGGEEDILYINDSNNVFYYHTETGEFIALFNWIHQDIDGATINQFFYTEDQTFLVPHNLDRNQIELIELKEAEASLEKEKTVLKLSCTYITNQIKENVLSFNRTHSKERIEIEDYSSYEDPAQALNLDMIAGKIPDILSIDSLPALQYIKKGILTDLSFLMEQDKEVKKEDFIESVYHALEYNGKLYYMGSDFSVRPLLGSNKFTKGMEAWTVDDMFALYEKLPKNGLFLCNDTYNMSRQLFLQNILSNQLEDYIRMDTSETFLDSSEFIKILEFSKNFPEESEIAENIKNRFEIGMPLMVQRGKLILSDCFNLSCMPDIQAFMKMYQKVGGFTIMNYPSLKGDDKLSMTINNTMAMTEQCAQKEAAWEFVRMFLTYDYQKNKGFYDGIPTRKDAFEKMLEYSMTTETFTDADGMFVEPVSIQYVFDDYTVIVGPLKKKETDMIRSIVNRVGKCTYNDSVTKEISNIVIEEAETFFSGDKTAEEAAQVMQNRAKIYVSENS